jgi:hypothetical protein
MLAEAPKPVVWSVWLVASVLGAELVLLGVVGLVAAAPTAPSTTLDFFSGTGSRVVTFGPALAWGGVYLTLSVPSQPVVCPGPGGCSPPPGAVTEGAVVSCVDPSCSALGNYWANWSTNAPTSIDLDSRGAPTPATVFLVKVYRTDTPVTVVTLTETFAGLTKTGLYAAGAALAGGALLVVALASRLVSSTLGGVAPWERPRSIECWRCRRWAPPGAASCPRCGASLG